MSGANQLSVFERYGKLQLMVLSQLVTTFAVLYLATLVIFAIVRIFTGISIKRIGYFSLKYIVFHPKTGVEVRIGKLGISFHRPTVARPGWISLHIMNCEVVIDTKVVSEESFPLEERRKMAAHKKNSKNPKLNRKESREFLNEYQTIQLVPKSNKQLFRLAQWLLPRLKVIDINFGSLSVTYTDVATLVLGYASYRMDGRSLNTKANRRTRSVGTLDTYELQKGEMRVISRLQMGDVFLARSLDDEDPHQVLDSLVWTFSGVLNKSDLSLKELQFGLQAGIVNVNYERLVKILKKIKSYELSQPLGEDPLASGSTSSAGPTPARANQEDHSSDTHSGNVKPTAGVKPNGDASGDTSGEKPSEDDAETTNKTEHRRKIAFIGLALLRLVKLIEFKVQSVNISGVPLKREVLLHGKPVMLTSSFNDFSLDVRRMSSESPGFKLMFGSGEAAAHQSIFSLTSLKLALDTGKVREEIIYVPMVTILTRGNVFSGTLRVVESQDKKANRSLVKLSANVQSPSINIETHHLAILEQLLGKEKVAAAVNLAKPPSKAKLSQRHIKIRIPFQNLLPLLDCSMLVQDPAMRLVVDDEDSMFILSCSRIGGHLVSTHVTGESEGDPEMDNYYRVNAMVETSTVESFYHSKTIPHFEILNFSSTGFKATAVTRPELSVKVQAWMGNVQFQLLHWEIFQKLRILYLTMGQRQLERRAKSKMRSNRKKSGSPLRKLPAFVSEVEFNLDGAKLAVASDRFRNQKNSLLGLEIAAGHVRVAYLRDAEKKPGQSFTDGRSLQIQIRALTLSRVSEDYHGLLAQEDEQAVRQALLLDMPELTLGMTTKTERDEPVVAVTYDLPKLVADININQLLAVMVIREVVDVAMGSDLREQETEKMEVAEEARRRSSSGVPDDSPATAAAEKAASEALRIDPPDQRTISGRMGNVRLKIDLPQENRLMVEIVHAKVTRARRQNPTLKAKSLRLFSRYPFYRSAWCIVMSLVNVNVTVDVMHKTENKIFAEISTMRINIPFRFKLYRIIDNSITMAKAIKTLITQTKKGDPLLFLNPKEHPHLPNIPNVFIRTNRLQIQMEDDKFEADLNLVFQVGRIEAEVRYEMEKMFESQIKDVLRGYIDKAEKKEADKPTVRVQSPNGEADDPMDSSASATPQPQPPKRSETQDSAGFFRRLVEVPIEFGTTYGSHPWHKFWNSSKYSSLRREEVTWTFDEHGATSSPCKCSVEEAHERLLKYFARSWYRSVNHNRNKQREGVINRRHDFADDVMDPVTCEEEMIINYTDTPPIWSLAFLNTDLRITRSEFPDMLSTKQFMHDMGKGLPTDVRYSIFVPLYLDIKAYGGARMDLFDFPIPLLHFPTLAQNQDPAGTGLHINGNFIIAEALQTEERSIRRLFVPVQPVPPSQMNTRSVNVLEIHRTLAPIKSFTDLKFVSKSIWPTRVCWCPAYKPAFAALQQGFGGFTKPPIDPSTPLGWWDKIRLVLHGRFTFDLGESPLYFILKGGRSPYALTGSDAGFAFVWRKNVKVVINGNDNPKDLFVVDSDIFEFVIPNFLTWEADYVRRSHGERADFWRTDYSAMYESSKVIMHFGNKIQWKLGMMFEQRVPKSIERTSKFKPHWDVQMSMPEYIEDKANHDCYGGFRSEFMYLALNIHSTDTGGNNSVHLTVAAFHHFQTWLGQFKSTLWPPIRAGKLFPGEMKPKKAKFSATLRGVQYQLALKPLIISFVEGRSGRPGHLLSYTYSGAKARATSFVLDLHTRREPVKGSKHWRMRMNLGQVDVENTDIRTLLGRVRPHGAPNRKQTRTGTTQPSSAASQRANSYYTPSIDGQSTRPGSSAPSSLNHDSGMPSSFDPESGDSHEWSSIDDFTDVGILLGRVTKNDPFQVEVLPFMYIPHFTYMRQTDHSTSPYVYHEGKKYLKFGKELVHDCMLQNRHPGKIQGDLLAWQRDELKERLADATENLRSLQDQPTSQAVLDRIERAKQIIASINKAIERLNVLVDYGHEAYERSKQGASKDNLPSMAPMDPSKAEAANLTAASDPDRTPVAGTPANTSLTDTSGDKSQSTAKADASFASATNTSKDYDMSDAEELIGTGAIRSDPTSPSMADEGDQGGSAVRKPEDNDNSQAGDEEMTGDDAIPERLTAPSNRLPFKSRFYMEETDDLSSPASHYAFDNRYVVYSMHARWNNRVRDRILRLKLAFTYQQNLRHARFYRAISELEELMETLKAKGGKTEPDNAEVKKEAEYDDERVHYNSHYRTADARLRTLTKEIVEVQDGCELVSSHLVRLLSPQIQLISEKNPTKFMQLFARDIDIRVVNLFDADEPHTPAHKLARRVGCLIDHAAGLVFSEKDQALFDVGAVSVKSFVLRNADPLLEKHQTPWLSIDQCYNSDVVENFMIVKHTDLGVRIDTPNSLHYSRKQASGCTMTSCGKRRKINVRFDHSRYRDLCQVCMEDPSIKQIVMVDLPQIIVACDSVQFFTAYMIATDLIAYHDPIHQSYSDAVDRVVLATDFSGGSEQMIAHIRERQLQVNQLYTYRLKYLVRNKGAVRGQYSRRLHHIESEYYKATLELMVLTRAFTAGVQQSIRPDATSYNKISLLVDEVIGHVLDERGKSFLDVAMAHVHYSKVSSENRFGMNQVKIGMFQGWNLLPNAIYPEIVSPFGHFDKTRPQISARWTSLEPVGGIPILDDVSIKVQPLRLQFEQHIVDLLMNFAFPVRSQNKNKQLTANGGSHRDSDDDELSDSEASDDDDDEEPDSDADSEARSLRSANGSVNGEKRVSRFSRLFRSSGAVHARRTEDHDVNEMVNRASSYMNLIDFVIHATELTISYKGRSRSNLLDLQEVTIPLPTIHYSNKMWNKLDLLERLKKDIVKVLVNHSYAIIGNRFRRHKDKGTVIKGPIEHYNPLQRVRSAASSVGQITHMSRTSEHDEDQLHVTPVYQMDDARRPSTVPLSSMRQPTQSIDHSDLISVGANNSITSRKSHNPFKRLKQKIHQHHHEHEHEREREQY